MLHRTRIAAFLLIAVLCSLPEARSAEPVAKLEGTSRALVSIRPTAGWSAGARFQMDRRKFKIGEETMDLDINHMVGHIGYRVLPFVHLLAEAGASHADWVQREGERGFEWAVGADVSVLEHLIRESPVVGRKQSIAIGATVRYRHAESNFGDADFDWSELRVAPSISYTVNRRGEVLHYTFEPISAKVRAGVAFCSVDGEYGDQDVEQDRDFGLVVGADLLANEGWTLQIEGTFFGSSDNEVGVGVGYYF